MFISEEVILSNYYLDPFQVVGTEGMWGLGIYLALLALFQNIKCGVAGEMTGLQDALCDYGFIENSAFAFKQMTENKEIVFLSILMIVSIASFNVFGIATTKYASAA